MTISNKTLTAAAAGLAAVLAFVLVSALAGQSAHTGHTMPAQTVPAQTAPAAQKAGAQAFPVTVQGATVAAVPPSIRDTAAYMTLTNKSDQPIKLVGAATPLASSPMLMTTTHSGGMAGMKMVPWLTIPARGTLTLQRDGDHVMLMGLKRPLKVGETVNLTLKATDGRTLNVAATVKKN